MGDTQILPAYPKDIGFEQVWATLDRITQKQEETAKRQEETDRIIKEAAKRQKETDRIVKETAKQQEETALQMKKTDLQIQEYNKRFGDFTNRFGEIVEYMVAPGLQEKFRELGFIFQRTNNGSKFSDSDNKIKFQVDIILENGQKAMLVEVKSKLTTEDVKDHIERLGKMRQYADLHNDKRTFIGAVAGVVTPPNVKDFALNKGFFVIEPSGETFNITSPHNNCKEW